MPIGNISVKSEFSNTSASHGRRSVHVLLLASHYNVSSLVYMGTPF